MAFYREDIADIELSSGQIFRSFMNHTIGSGDVLADRFGVRVFRNGEPENIGGTCSGYFIRADGATVAITDGVVNGNLAYVTLPETCYAIEGQFSLAIKCMGAGTTGTMRIVDGVVSRTSTETPVDPGTIIPSIDDLIEAINEAVESIPSDYTDLENKVDDLESALTILECPVTWRNGYYIDENGNYIQYGEFNASEKISVYDKTGTIKRNIHIKLRLNSAAYIAFYDKNGDLIDTETTPSASGNPVFQTDTMHVSGCYYVAVSANKNYPDETIIWASFEETDIGGVYDLIRGKKNLFDPYDTRTQVGKLIDNSGNIVTVASEYAVSHPIPIKGGISYTYDQPTNKFGSAGHYIVCTHDGKTISKRTGNTIVNNTLTFTESADCFVMVNCSFSQTGRPFFKICETSMFNEKYDQYRGRLTGKFISYNGDSICESRTSGFSSNGGGYPLLISQLTGGIYENKAVSGGTLATNDQYHSVCETISTMDTNADIICLEGGINDYWQHIPLGTFSESDFTGTVDESTVCGALESIFRQAINKWVGKPIVFIIVHKITTTAWTVNNAGYTFAEEREKMIGICQKYSIPYLDMWAEGGLNAYMSALDNAFLNGGGNVHPDGCHPDVNGYKKYYVPRLIALFESLLPYDD